MLHKKKKFFFSPNGKVKIPGFYGLLTNEVYKNERSIKEQKISREKNK